MERPLVWVSPNEVAVHHRAPAASSYTLWIVPVDGGPRRLVADPDVVVADRKDVLRDCERVSRR